MCCNVAVKADVKMRSTMLSFILLIWYSAVSRAFAEGSLPSDMSLADEIIHKQKECDELIRVTISEILADEESDLHDIPIADESYYDCKEMLDKKKREYMSENNINTSKYPDFFPIKPTQGAVMLISVPKEEGEERSELEFDVNEELCITSDECGRLLDLIAVNKGKDKLSKERYAHCSVLLDDIKLKFIREYKLDDKKLKNDGGLSTKCMGKSVLLSLPGFMNNVDYRKAPHEHVTDPLMGLHHITADETAPASGSPTVDVQDVHSHIPEETSHPEPDKEHSKHVKGSGDASLEKANFIYCVLVIVVLVIFV